MDLTPPTNEDYKLMYLSLVEEVDSIHKRLSRILETHSLNNLYEKITQELESSAKQENKSV